MSDRVIPLLRLLYQPGGSEEETRLRHELEEIDRVTAPYADRREELVARLESIEAQRRREEVRDLAERALREEASRIHRLNPNRPAGVWREWAQREAAQRGVSVARALEIATDAQREAVPEGRA